MPRRGVSYDTVAQAATRLLHSGQHPSVQRVRRLLGTGSNTTISRHLGTWREQNASRTNDELPPGATPSSPAYSVLQAELTATREQLTETHQALDEAHSRIRELEQAMDQAQGQYLGAREQIQTIRQESDHTVNLAMQLTRTSQNRIGDLERQLADLQAAEEMHISDFEYALKRERERSDAEETRLRDQISALEHAARVAAERAARRLAASESETTRLREQVLALEKQLAERQSQLDVQLSASAFYKEELDDLRRRFDRLQRHEPLAEISPQSLAGDSDEARQRAETLAGREEQMDE